MYEVTIILKSNQYTNPPTPEKKEAGKEGKEDL